MKCLLLLVAILGLVAAEQVRYDGAQVLEVFPSTDAHFHILNRLREHYDFWMESKSPNSPTHIMARKDELSALQRELRMIGLSYEVIIPDVQVIFDEEKRLNDAALAKARKEGKAMDWTAYHDYDEIMAWCDSLAVTYPSLVTVEDVGQSYEGRTMKLVTVSTGDGTGKPKIFVDGGIHAREWIAPATATFLMNELLQNSADYQSTLDAVDFHFMPSINPDGYQYSFDTDRDWRKTRSPNEGSSCMGTDPNRNWDFQWGVSGSSSLPCSEVYKGSIPFSEIETTNVDAQMKLRQDDIKLYLSYHSYGQLVLYPWGYTTDDADRKPEFQALGDLANAAIFAEYGTEYTVDEAAFLGEASGASDDYAYGALNIPYSYTIELRNKFSFSLPPEQIIPTGEENFAGFQVMFEFIRDNY